MTINNFKKTMADKAKKKGICENFGQTEIRYNPYGTEKERQVARQIDNLDEWVMNFDLSQITA
jgi:hypothetical protein